MRFSSALDWFGRTLPAGDSYVAISRGLFLTLPTISTVHLTKRKALTMQCCISEEEGCFVFQVINNTICVRSQPNILNEDKTRLEFEVGELVSVDLIQHSSDQNNGPYLRLTDRSGWLFVNCMGQERMRSVHVERGLWAVYVDNFPHGQYLRRHPVVSPDLELEVGGQSTLYEPTTKLYCDARTTHLLDGITFYRVQGTRGWVFDRKPLQKGDSVGGRVRQMLLPDVKVREELLLYKALEDCVIRLKPVTDSDAMTLEVIKAGEMVAIDYVREDLHNSGDGPFLRLSDGAGWLFEKKQGVQMMTSVTASVGSWELRVLNPPVGVGLRRHPIICQDKLFPIVYPTGCMIQCDRQVCTEDGTYFYHVVGTHGWVFDRRDGVLVLELLSADTKVAISMNKPWDPNFVRGVAATVDEITEVDIDMSVEDTGVLTFTRQSEDAVNVHVYCKSRTVAVTEKGGRQVCKHNCTTKDLLSMLNFDLVEYMQMVTQDSNDATLGRKSPAPLTLSVSQNGELPARGDSGVEIIDSVGCHEKVSDEKETESFETEEAEEAACEEPTASVATNYVETTSDELVFRKQLTNLEEEEKATNAQRTALLTKIKVFDDQRGAQIAASKQMAEDRLQEMKAKEYAIVEKEEEEDHFSESEERGLMSSSIPEEFLEQPHFTIENYAATTDAPLSPRSSQSPRLPPRSPRSPQSVHSTRSRRSHRSKRSHSKRAFQCGECDEVFKTGEDREDHCRDDHGIECEECDMVFKSFRALDVHRDREDHW
jgi:uncharacterized C2H2 Zn-finger protein